MNTNALPFGLGAILLGAVGIWFHDFAMQWQPVPADFPLRMQFAIVTGLLLILGGGETLSGKWAHGGAALLAAIYGLWVLILHAPLIVTKPTDLGTWNGVAEIVLMIAGAVALYAGMRGKRGRLATAVCLVTGFCALVFGATHFKYVEFTATMVPTWIPPNQIFWAYATGIVHVATGLSLRERHPVAAGCDGARRDDGGIRGPGAHSAGVRVARRAARMDHARRGVVAVRRRLAGPQVRRLTFESSPVRPAARLSRQREKISHAG